MSRTSVMYIEYRKNSNSPWRWVRPLMPAQDIDWAEDDPGYMVQIIKKNINLFMNWINKELFAIYSMIMM